MIGSIVIFTVRLCNSEYWQETRHINSYWSVCCVMCFSGNGSLTLCLFNRRAREEVQVKIIQDDVAPGKAPTDQGGVFRKKRKNKKVKKKEGKPKKKKERKKKEGKGGREAKKEVGWEELRRVRSI